MLSQGGEEPLSFYNDHLTQKCSLWVGCKTSPNYEDGNDVKHCLNSSPLKCHSLYQYTNSVLYVDHLWSLDLTCLTGSVQHGLLSVHLPAAVAPVPTSRCCLLTITTAVTFANLYAKKKKVFNDWPTNGTKRQHEGKKSNYYEEWLTMRLYQCLAPGTNRLMSGCHAVAKLSPTRPWLEAVGAWTCRFAVCKVIINERFLQTVHR